jgi:hypothetical protein
MCSCIWNSTESPEVGAWKIKGINPSDSGESGRQEEIKGINPSDSAESGRQEEIKGINPSESAESGRQAGMRGKSAPDFTGGCPKQSIQNRAM